MAGAAVGYVAGAVKAPEGAAVPTICDYKTIGDISPDQSRVLIDLLGRDGFVNDVSSIKRGQIRECSGS